MWPQLWRNRDRANRRELMPMLLAALLSAVLQASWAVSPTTTSAIEVPREIQQATDELEYADSTAIKGVSFDFNHDGVVDYLLQSAPSLCGNGGCVFLLFDGASHRRIGRFFGSTLRIDADATGFPVIATLSRQSADAATYTAFRFRDTAYQQVAVESVTGDALERLVATLRGLPTRPM